MPTRPSAGRGAGQLWFLGLTAMTLLFAALLILAQLTRGGSLAASVAPILFAYAIGIAVLGVGALAYVTYGARALGSLASEGPAGDPVAAGSGLRVAPAVPPRGQALPTQTRSEPVGPPSVGPPSVSPPSEQSQRAPAPVGPASLPVASALSQAPAAVSSSAARRAAVQTIRMPRPVVAGTASPRPYPFPAPRVEQVALQVRVAGLRSAAWGPRPPTLVDRLLGRGTHRSYPPQERRSGLMGPVPTPGPMSPAPATTPTRAPSAVMLAHR